MELNFFYKYGGGTKTLTAMSTLIVEKLKQRIQDKEGVPPESQVIFLGSRCLDNPARKLEDYNVTNDVTLQASEPLLALRAQARCDLNSLFTIRWC